jgi:hypothetical protein
MLQLALLREICAHASANAVILFTANISKLTAILEVNTAVTLNIEVSWDTYAMLISKQSTFFQCLNLQLKALGTSETSRNILFLFH